MSTTAPLTDPVDIATQANVEKALRLREEGASYRDIAKALGFQSVSWAHTLVMRGLDELHDRIAESADRMRAIENRRLDRMTQGLLLRSDKDSPAVALALLRIQERRAKLNGLDLDKDEAPQPGGGGLTGTAEARDTLRGKITAIRSRTDAAGVTTTESLEIETSQPLPTLGSAVHELTKIEPHTNGNGTNGDHG